jgi:hypothetical protein
MMHKTRPHAAVRTAPRFVINERERRLKAREITKEQALIQQKAEEAKRRGASEEEEIADAVLNGILDGEGDDDLSSAPTHAQASPRAPTADLS